MVERFQQVAFLLIITLRNVVELSESSPSSILPSTFVPLIKLPATATVSALMTPVMMVIASELIVDWLKHAFITKFNQIRPSIYGKYIDVLCKDLVVGSPGRLSGRRNVSNDERHLFRLLTRQTGFCGSITSGFSPYWISCLTTCLPGKVSFKDKPSWMHSTNLPLIDCSHVSTANANDYGQLEWW